MKEKKWSRKLGKSKRELGIVTPKCLNKKRSTATKKKLSELYNNLKS